jgi:hypothetical protein
MATKVSEFCATSWRRQGSVRRRARASKLSFASSKTLPKSATPQVFVLSEQEPNKTLEELQVRYETLKTEIERLTADLAITRRRLRAERYRTRRLVDMISHVEQPKNRAKKSVPVLELSESAEALAVLLAQQRFRSQSRTL